MAQPIENHGVVGNLRTAALIGLGGAVDFLCWPRFDSPSIFASLLDDERGGAFELAPVLDGARHRQLYLPDTNVLLTRFLSPDGVAEISDFMVSPRVIETRQAAHPNVYGATHGLDAPDKPRAGVPVLESHEV